MILPAVLALLIVHELGHVWAAASFGVPVRQLRLGIGPVILRCTCGRLRILVCCLPIGATVGFERAAVHGPAQIARIAAGGLLAGGLACLAMMALSFPLHSLAIFVAGILCLATNLLNSLPLPGLDGWRLMGFFQCGAGATAAVHVPALPVGPAGLRPR